ncbi:cobalamin biosynthesis protein CbiX [Sedimentimonas flavescens]|uniref:Cobalamin biosynthesis protein CbiX n=1 Tax=Sedimentimonas flavescens TaxID=2851012 RepID=A0ABT2ZZ70_9RHOB|nr:CbiX/SirB N-terminal domain-containing protein [Sedimentimonas flavescens]MCV2879046.1 cobalamin biosynthesis protein CbiX [Sedimentimonas flavescens]
MKQIVIVAHGSPSDPAPQEAALQDLAQRVGALCPDDTVRAATLACPGALEAAFEGLSDPLVYPFFMAEGWFTRRELPRRLAKAGLSARHMRPFGLDPHLPALIAQTSHDAAIQAGLEPESADLILVGHGSKVAHRSKDSTYAMAETLRRSLPFWRIRVALIEEPPFLANIAAQSLRGLCLPFFALRAGHVENDIPEALEEAAFNGPLLPAIGEHPQVPALIAAAIVRE